MNKKCDIEQRIIKPQLIDQLIKLRAVFSHRTSLCQQQQLIHLHTLQINFKLIHNCSRKHWPIMPPYFQFPCLVPVSSISQQIEKMDIKPRSKLGFAGMPSRKRDSLKCQDEACHTRHFAIFLLLLIFEMNFPSMHVDLTELPLWSGLESERGLSQPVCSPCALGRLTLSLPSQCTAAVPCISGPASRV